jgi:hypothetical protein
MDSLRLISVISLDEADEIDEVSGSGWLQLRSKDGVEGLIKFHGGDRSTFKARKAD